MLLRSMSERDAVLFLRVRRARARRRALAARARLAGAASRSCPRPSSRLRSPALRPPWPRRAASARPAARALGPGARLILSSARASRRAGFCFVRRRRFGFARHSRLVRARVRAGGGVPGLLAAEPGVVVLAAGPGAADQQRAEEHQLEEAAAAADAPARRLLGVGIGSADSSWLARPSCSPSASRGTGSARLRLLRPLARHPHAPAAAPPRRPPATSAPRRRSRLLAVPPANRTGRRPGRRARPCPCGWRCGARRLQDRRLPVVRGQLRQPALELGLADGPEHVALDVLDVGEHLVGALVALGHVVLEGAVDDRGDLRLEIGRYRLGRREVTLLHAQQRLQIGRPLERAARAPSAGRGPCRAKTDPSAGRPVCPSPARAT